MMKIIDGGVTAAEGFQAAGLAAGIKKGNTKDMALVYSQVPCVAAGTFTTNVVKAAPVKWDQQVVKSGAKAQAVVVNSGIANACTGAEGFGYCKDTADAAAKALNISADGEDIGFVGDVKEVNADIIYDLLEKDFLPIIAPIGLDDEYNTYNINADDAACAIAKAINAEKLAFLTDIEGVYKDPNDPSTLISELNVSEGKKLMEEGYIGGGMLPKIQNCIDAIENGVSRVHILDGRIPHCLLLEIFTNKGIGTAIKNDVEERYYHGE